VPEDKFSKIKTQEESFGIFYPKDYIVATFKTQEQIDQAVAALAQAGYTGDNVLPFTSEEVLARHAQEEADMDGWERFKSKVGSVFGDESHFLQQSLDLARDGYQFILIYAPDETDEARVGQALVTLMPQSVRKYNELAIEDIL
jgi:hypothetical protein